MTKQEIENLEYFVNKAQGNESKSSIGGAIMSNETMPEMSEKIFIDEVYWYLSHDDVRAGGNDLTPYTRTDTIPNVAELQRQNAVLKAFVRTIINENCFGYDGELDGLDVQDQAASSGIILPETVTREMMDEWERTESSLAGDFMEGDTIYHFAHWMTDDTAKIPIPSRAEVAREFFEAVNNYYDQGWTGMTWYGCAKKVLQEWEDAENS